MILREGISKQKNKCKKLPKNYKYKCKKSMLHFTA